MMNAGKKSMLIHPKDVIAWSACPSEYPFGKVGPHADVCGMPSPNSVALLVVPKLRVTGQPSLGCLWVG